MLAVTFFLWIILEPPRFPRLDAAHRTMRHVPLPGMTSPTSGLAASQLQNAPRSSSVHMSPAAQAQGNSTLPQSSRNLPFWKRAPRVCCSSQAVV